jgi:WxL interacting protein linking bacterial and host surfaces
LPGVISLWRRRSWLSLLAVGGVMAMAGTPAVAQGAATFALKPSAASVKRGYFVKAARPGSRISDEVQVINVGDRAGRVRLFTVDATTGQTSGVVYGSGEQRQQGVGAWMRLGARTLALAPGESRTVPFTVRVPFGAPGGEHLGGIVAAPVLPVARRAGRTSRRTFQINVREQAIIAVQVSLPGPRHQSLAITGARPGGTHGFQALLVGLANRGNTLLKGRGTLTVTDRGGRVRKRVRFALDTFVPRTQIAYPAYLHGGALGPGRYVATVAIRYGAGHRVTRSVPFAISRAQVKQVFGSVTAGSGDGGGSGPSVLLLVLGGIGLVLLGAGGSALVVRRRLRSTASSGPR